MVVSKTVMQESVVGVEIDPYSWSLSSLLSNFCYKANDIHYSKQLWNLL